MPNGRAEVKLRERATGTAMRMDANRIELHEYRANSAVGYHKAENPHLYAGKLSAKAIFEHTNGLAAEHGHLFEGPHAVPKEVAIRAIKSALAGTRPAFEPIRPTQVHAGVAAAVRRAV